MATTDHRLRSKPPGQHAVKPTTPPAAAWPYTTNVITAAFFAASIVLLGLIVADRQRPAALLAALHAALHAAPPAIRSDVWNARSAGPMPGSTPAVASPWLTPKRQDDRPAVSTPPPAFAQY